MRFPKFFSALLAAVLVISGFSVAQSPSAEAAGKTYITFSASVTSRTAGQNSTLTAKYYKSGKLQKSGSLYLQYKSGSKWVDVRTLKVSKSGTATTVVAPTVNRTYRIAAANNKVLSPTVAVKLKSGFTIKASKSSASKGTAVKFTASYFNKGKARTGKVQLQYNKSGKWKTLKTLTLKKGTVAYTHKPSATMKWRYRFPSTGAVSKATTVKITPAVSKSEAATAKSYITFSASVTSRTAGQNSTLTTKYYKAGKLQKSGTLYLQYKSGSKWINARTLKIAKSGTTKTTVNPTVNRTYRIATSKNKVVSPTVAVKLKSGFTIKASKTSISKGTAVKFTASNFNKGKARTGKVQLQYYKSGKWKTLKTLTLKKGTAAYTHKPGTTLKWRFRYPTSGAVTKSTKVSIKPQLALTSSASSITSGKSVTLKVTLKRNGTNVSSEKVTLQRKTGSTWETEKSLTVKSGKVSTTVKPTATTSYRVITKDSVTSTTRAVKVTNPVPVENVYYVISSVQLNLRKGAGTSFESMLPKLAYGEQVTALSETRVANNGFDWINVKTSDGREGWVADVYLSKTKPATTNGSFTLTGSGFGHGIGMSQYGAYQMAGTGSSAAAILKHYYTGTTVGNQAIPSSLQNVKIQVLGPETFGFSKAAYGDSYTTRTLTFASATGASGATWRLRTAAGESVLVNGNQNIPVTHKLRITRSSTKVKAEILDASNKVVTTTPIEDTIFRVHLSGTSYYRPTYANAVVTVPGANGTYNNGRLEISVISSVLNVTNQLKLNSEYLYGIAEMPSSWGSDGGGAALEAQAIAARTYALKTARTSKASIALCNCNLVDDIRHQNFTGWRKQGEGTNQTYGNIWKAAVDKTVNSATSGDVVKHNGTYISTYYYSASGGKTANSEDVWDSALPYLKSVTDNYSLSAPGNPNKAWTDTLSQSAARKIFTALPDVESLAVTTRYSSGQVKTMTATSSTGKTQQVTMKADKWRTALGTKASWITAVKAN